MTAAGPDLLEDPPPDLAAEYALGVLDGAERVEAERLLLADRAFATDVEAWRWRLAALAEEAAAREAPDRVWPAIARRLDDGGVGGGGGGGGGVVELKLRRALTIWRGAAAFAGAVAAGLAIALVRPRPTPLVVAPAPAPLETASLSGAKGSAVAYVAVLDTARRELVLTPAAVSPTPGRSPELWVIPTGGKPVSLGVVAFARPVRVALVAGLGDPARRTLAVSLEPTGGSPTGQPTGPVVATGELRAL